MESGFEFHQPSLRSRLEEWRSDIVAMRVACWPYRRIAAWLLENYQVRISREAIRQFCKVRGITKGESSNESKAVVKPIRKYSQKSGVFHYDDSQPIELKRK